MVLAIVICGFALASLLMPNSTHAQDSFRTAMLDAGRQAVSEGKINRRDMLRLRIALIMPRTSAQIQGMVLQELWLAGDIGDNFNEDGSYDVSQVDWGDGVLLQKIIDNLPAIIDFIKALIEIFGGFSETDTNGPPLTDPDAQAARAMVHNLSARLATNMATIRANAETEEFTTTGLNSAIGRAIDDAFSKSKSEFQAYSQPRIINAVDPLPVLDGFILGFNGG